VNEGTHAQFSQGKAIASALTQWLELMTQAFQTTAKDAAVYKCLLWMQGRTFAQTAQHMYVASNWIQEWHKRFQTLHMTAERYTPTFFKAKHASTLKSAQDATSSTSE